MNREGAIMDDSRKIDLACLGILVVDVFGKSIDSFPAQGTSAYFDTLEIHPGGCAYNTGVTAARLGLNVSVLGKVGEDNFGDTLIDSLQQEGISNVAVTRSPTANTALSFVMVSRDGQRRLYHNTGANRTFELNDVSKEVIRNARAFHVAGASLMPGLDGEPTMELLRYARKHGVVTSLDPVVREDTADIIMPCLPHLDIFLPNTEESLHITGYRNADDQLRYYLDHGARIVGIKLGEAGVLISDGQETLRLGVFDVPVIDTCGAGDAFIAGFLYAHLAGWDLQKSARFATGTAAFCVQSIGATAGIRQAATILEFLACQDEIQLNQ